MLARKVPHQLGLENDWSKWRERHRRLLPSRPSARSLAKARPFFRLVNGSKALRLIGRDAFMPVQVSCNSLSIGNRRLESLVPRERHLRRIAQAELGDRFALVEDAGRGEELAGCIRVRFSARERQDAVSFRAGVSMPVQRSMTSTFSNARSRSRGRAVMLRGEGIGARW